jgi:tRNA (cmo5U34)-methyltransferase
MADAFFDRWANEYDRARRQLIPCFDNFYGAALDSLRFLPGEPARILDLGAGTGLLSAFILARYPGARLVLQDESNEMLAIARERFQALGGQVSYLLGDYSRELSPGPFHAVVSALSIHHLVEADKLRLFQRLPPIVRSGGTFVNADQVLGETPEQEAYFRETWLADVRAAGVSAADLEAALERMKADRMSTLSMQLDGLCAAGFQEVSCVFQDKSFVVYVARLEDSRAFGM